MLRLRFSLLPLMLVVSTIGCGEGARTPAAPTNPAGTVTGFLRGEAPPPSRIFTAHPPLSNATVTVIGGPASGTKTTTGADGAYQIAASGTFKLRFEHPLFETSESSATVMTTGGVTIPDVTLLTAPWSVSGLVTDSRGAPVPDVQVVFRPGTFYAADFGSVRTDAAGRYVFNSARPHFANVMVVASKPGFEPLPEQAVRCCGAAPDLRLVRVVSITPTAPSSLRVGESLEMPASVVVFDTGETRNIFVLPASSAPAVVAVSPSSHWYEMRGVDTGVATLTFDLWGAIATMQVQVR
jgi:hypothetical protein